jgi:outer membrane lipoprotein-sorting protein
MRSTFLILLITLSLAPITNAAKIQTTEDLVQAMQKKYAKSWYKTATFVQKTTEYDKDGNKKVSTWYEALSVPGSLRIDFTPVKDGNGILFTNNTVYSFKDGKVENSRPFVHPLMILGFDIYRLSMADALDKLKGLKFDLAILREDTWQGRPVYVVGAKQGDLHSPQFWIDKKNLYFVRMLRPAGKDGAQTQETQFNKYQRLGGGWMAPEVIFKVDDQIRTTEEYSDLRADTALDSKLFDPQYWTTIHWKE